MKRPNQAYSARLALPHGRARKSCAFLRSFRDGLGCLRRRDHAKGFYVRNKLPTLRLRQFGPYRHASANHTIGQNPEHSSRCGTLDFDSTQTRGFFATERGFAMAFGTVLLKQIFPSRNSIRILLERVTLRASFLRRLFNFAVHRGPCRFSRFVDILACERGPRGQRRRNTKRRQAGLYLPLPSAFHRSRPKRWLTRSPNPAIS